MTPAESKKRTQNFALRVFRLVEALPKSYAGASSIFTKSFGVRRQREPQETGDGAFGRGESIPIAATRYRLPPHSNTFAISATAGVGIHHTLARASHLVGDY